MWTKHDYSWMVLGWLFLLPGICLGQVSGICSNCHTMHNSQNGVLVDTGGPNTALLNTDCAGCHQGQNNGSNETPYVFDPNGPNYGTTGTEGTTSTLAGGNFYWLTQAGGDRTGHNVEGIAAIDGTLGNTPPGGTDLGGRLTCAGSLGCHGDRTEADATAAIFGSHHTNDMSSWKNGSSVAQSYRFLNTVEGLEDPAYEYRPTAAGHHNKYYGNNRASEADAPGTISSLCAQCHGDFHQGSGNLKPASATFGDGVWLRHPTDFDMNSAQTSSEYASYNGGSGTDNPYSVISPVATASTNTTLNTTVFSQADDAIVMCLSCHRAHGTPNDAILRWDYKSWPGGGYNGCVICHTSKD